MEIVAATKEEIPAIVELMKLSLGEALMPKSEAYFIWKHFTNPFGTSTILLAKQNEKIIGLRAFMKWQWVNKDGKYLAVRAVDTATLPSFQGKGVFSKLTQAVVKISETEGASFVFNSPNPISLRGYLKMGWYSIGKMPVKITIGSLLPRFFSNESLNKFYNQYSVEKALQKIHENWSLSFDTNNFHTPICYNYLHWRYFECPVAKYGAVIEPKKFGFIFRIKSISKFMELRICECWAETNEGQKELNIEIKKLIQNIRPLLISEGTFQLGYKNSKLKRGPIVALLKGPIVTIRKLGNTSMEDFNHFKNWKPSLGSMELF